MLVIGVLGDLLTRAKTPAYGLTVPGTRHEVLAVDEIQGADGTVVLDQHDGVARVVEPVDLAVAAPH